MEKDDIERILKNIPIDGAEIGAFLRDATPEQRKQYQDKAKPKRERARLKAEIKYWRHLHKFKTALDVPRLPHAEENLWKVYFVPALIEAGAIPLVEMEDGVVYEGNHRVGKVARWNAEVKEFTYPYWEWNQKTTMKCNHFENDNGFALFVPLKRVAGKEVDLLTFLD